MRDVGWWVVSSFRVSGMAVEPAVSDGSAILTVVPPGPFLGMCGDREAWQSASANSSICMEQV